MEIILRVCAECGKDTNNPKFCSSSCCARQTNRLRPKRNPTGQCKSCGEPLVASLTYCKKCKPKHNTIHRTGDEVNKCIICGILKTEQNTNKNKSSKTGLDTYCKSCLSQLSTLKARRTKKSRVDYKGGCCEKCGYSKSTSALQFHHKDPSTKEFGIAALNTDSDNPKIREELDKCSLLCANCHYEEHNSEYVFDECVIKYEERLFKVRNNLI